MRMVSNNIRRPYELKSLLEGYAARVGAERITDKGLEKLRRINEQLVQLAEKGGVEAFFQVSGAP